MRFSHWRMNSLYGFLIPATLCLGSSFSSLAIAEIKSKTKQNPAIIALRNEIKYMHLENVITDVRITGLGHITKFKHAPKLTIADKAIELDFVPNNIPDNSSYKTKSQSPIPGYLSPVSALLSRRITPAWAVPFSPNITYIHFSADSSTKYPDNGPNTWFYGDLNILFDHTSQSQGVVGADLSVRNSLEDRVGVVVTDPTGLGNYAPYGPQRRPDTSNPVWAYSSSRSSPKNYQQVRSDTMEGALQALER